MGYITTIVPKIEQHSQGPAINFYESLKGKDVYVWPIGFRSYAHYFYFNVPNKNNADRQDENFLLYGKTNKPTYFVTKINEAFLDNKKEDFTLLKTEGGFKFYKRK